MIKTGKKQYLNLFKNVLLTGGDITAKQEELHAAYDSLSREEMMNLLLQKDKTIKENDSLIEHYESEERPKRQRVLKDIEMYDIFNFHKFFRTEDGKILSSTPELYQYTPNLSAFDKNLKVNKKYFRDYQKKFIEDWTVSAQELVILYYGVGSGKTMIAVNCAEQFTEITPNSHVYFIVPASLILGTIKEMYDRGIDAKRKDEKGDFIYYFISYQQMLGSNVDFKDNSLLIIDEAHNLRNFGSKELVEKKSARKYVKTGNYSLVGNKLAELLLTAENKFLRTIMMTGTLLVNSPEDLEALMSIGYKKQPLLKLDEAKYEILINSPNEFKIYYEGLISFYRIPQNYPTMPKKVYEIVPFVDSKLYMLSGKQAQVEDPYYSNTRNQTIEQKVNWIIEFLLKAERNKEKSLIYSQFLGKSILPLKAMLEENEIPYLIITGELSGIQKLNVVKQYNDNEIRVLIFTLSIKEGISFKETDNIIVMQPYWNYAIMEQVLARGIRLNSHAQGQKAKIYIYFLVAIKENSRENIEWIKQCNKIFNDDIKTLLFPYKAVKDVVRQKDFGALAFNNGSRDIDMVNRMIRKQENINEFENKLLSLPSFEDVNNTENNEFIKDFKETLLELDSKGETLTNKQQIALKKQMYSEFYTKNIAKVSSSITRFLGDARYKTTRNPNLIDKMEKREEKNIETDLKKLIDKGASLDEMFKAFKIDKQEIVLFQANFTPSSKCDEVIELSGIKNDKRSIIRILEPTAGIGNMISSLLKLNNKSNFFIDCNEFHNVFYQIGKSIYSEIDNIHWYNADFYIYNNKYNYDYIVGNPPFNLPYSTLIPQKVSKPKKTIKVDPADAEFVEYDTVMVRKDLHLYDVDFVAKAYNMLSTDGILTFIISDRFQRSDNISTFVIFNSYLKYMISVDKDSVFITGSTQFKKDKGVVKEQETNFGMVIIRLRKIKDFIIDLNNKKLVKNIISDDTTITPTMEKTIDKIGNSTSLKTRTKSIDVLLKPKKIKE